MKSPAQFLYPIPADREGIGGAADPEGKAAVIPGKNILDIFQVD